MPAPPPVVADADRFRAICRTMGEMLADYRVTHPDRFRALLDSKMADTDAHVLSMLRRYGRRTAAFEDDVWFALRYVWRVAIERNPDFRAYLDVKQRERQPDAPDLRPLCHTDTMLDRIRTRPVEPDPNRVYFAMRDVADVKTHLTDWVQSRSTPAELSGGQLCPLLICRNRRHAPGQGVGFVLNSMWYCDDHAGLAVFNGLRHSTAEFCGACGIWNVVALRATCMDVGHRHYAAREFEVPLRDTDAGPLNVRIAKFRDPQAVLTSKSPGWDIDAGFVDRLRLVGPREGVMYGHRRPEGRCWWRVPSLSWAMVNEHNVARAWIRVEIVEDPQTGIWVPVTAKDTLLEVLKLMRESNRSPIGDWGEDPPWRFPVRVPGGWSDREDFSNGW